MKSMREYRDAHLGLVEGVHTLLVITMVFFGMAMTISGIYFLENEFWMDVHFKLADVKTGLLFLISFFGIMVPVFGCIGYHIIKDRES